MRPELMNPVCDKRRLDAAIAMAQELYRLHEAGRDYSKRLPEFGELVDQPVSVADVHGAFGSVPAESFAEALLAVRSAIPKDLSEAEMLELIERICNADGTESQISYMGDEGLSDLISWPDEYFGDGDDSRELRPRFDGPAGRNCPQ